MSGPRLHLSSGLREGGSVRIEGERAHYLRNVLRLGQGAEARVFNAADGEWRARIAAVARHSVELEVESLLRAPQPEPGPVLAFAPIRRNRMEWLVEKAVELGVAGLVPVLTRRTVVRPERPDRLEAIAVEAAEQCERLTVPAVAAPAPLEEWLARRDATLPLLHAAERSAGEPILAALRRLPMAEILVGPEGGFAAEETARLAALPGVVAVTLGPLILRAETAALLAVAAWRLAQDPH